MKLSKTSTELGNSGKLKTSSKSWVLVHHLEYNIMTYRVYHPNMKKEQAHMK